MSANQATYPVTMLCRVLGVSPSGYYAWRERPPSDRSERDAVLTRKILDFHEASHGVYGRPRIHADLEEDGERVGAKRVYRLMRAAGIQGVTRRRKIRTTKRGKAPRAIPDLVDRDFTAREPNRLWVADITYVPTSGRFLYLAIVLDAWSRRVVGWAMATHLRTDLVLQALDMAIEQRRPTDVIHHSDQGCQYTSIAFGRRCREVGIRPSTGSVGDAYDNALAESFFASLECELLDRRRFTSQVEARLAVFSYIEGFYNPRRRHSALGQISPIDFERRYALQSKAVA